MFLCTLVTAQLVIDLDESPGRETRRYKVASGGKVAIHWTCTPSGPYGPMQKPPGCRDVARLDDLRAFSCCAGSAIKLQVASDGVDAVAVVDAGRTGALTYYASLNRSECLRGVRFALRATRRPRPGDGVPILNAAGDAFLAGLDGARAARDGERAAVAWVRNPADRWWADCRTGGSADACENLALMLASRSPRVVAAAAQTAPRRRALEGDASIFFRAERAAEHWPAWRRINPTAAPAPPLVTTEARSAGAQVALRGWLADDYRALAARGLGADEAGKVNFLHIPKTGGTTMPRTVNSTGHTGPSRFCATSP